MIIIYMILLVIFFLSCIIKKSRILMLLQFFWCWLLYGLNTGGADYIENEAIYLIGRYYLYDNIKIGTTWLADLLYIIFNRLNFSYIEFNLITGLIAFGIVFFIVWKISKAPNIVYALLMVYPMSEFIMQKRFFLAISLIMLGIYWFSTIDNKIKKNIALLICILLAVGLHFSTIFYLSLFCMNIDENKGIKHKLKIVFLLIIGGIPILIIGTKWGLISQEKISNYLSGDTSGISLYKIPYFFLLQVYLYYVTFLLYKKKNKGCKFEFNFMKYSKLLLFLLPTYFINTIFRRYYIHLIPLNYILMSDDYILNLNSKKTITVHLSLVINVLIIIYLAFIETRFFGDIGFDKLIVDLYRNNLIFKYLIL